MMNSNHRSKVFIVGIDGGTLELVKPWAEQGKLPTFARMMQSGVSGKLMSTIQPISASAWSSFATGKNPGKHGILDFVKSTPFSYKVQFVNASARDGKTLWRILSENGATVGVMNVPVTFPPEQVNGFLIAGMLSPSLGSEFTFPDGLLKEINANVGKYVIDVDVPNISSGDKRDLFLNKAMESLKIRRDAMRYLYLKYRPDFFCVAFTESDRISHNFWIVSARHLHCFLKILYSFLHCCFNNQNLFIVISLASFSKFFDKLLIEPKGYCFVCFLFLLCY